MDYLSLEHLITFCIYHSLRDLVDVPKFVGILIWQLSLSPILGIYLVNVSNTIIKILYYENFMFCKMP